MVLLTLPAVFMFIKQSDNDRMARVERRLKGLFPKISLLKTSPGIYFSEVGNYVEDHFPSRNFSINTYDVYKRNLKANDISHKKLYGHGEWLYSNYENETAYYIGDSIYSSRKFNQIKKVLRAKTTAFVKKNIPVYLIMPRNKHYVIPEHLPGFIRDRKADELPFDLFYKRINQDKKTPKVLDPSPLMRMVRKEGLEPYYKAGSHWNTIGSFLAYTMLMEEIKKDFSEVNIVQRSDLKFRAPTLMDSDFLQQRSDSELKEWYVAGNTFNTQKKYQHYTRHYQSKPNLFKTGNPGPRLLIVGDSFTDFMIPYLYCSFSEILFMHHQEGAFSQKEAMSFKPDLIVFEIYESMLNRDWAFRKN